jgi:hypothetical protein
MAKFNWALVLSIFSFLILACFAGSVIWGIKSKYLLDRLIILKPTTLKPTTLKFAS